MVIPRAYGARGALRRLHEREPFGIAAGHGEPMRHRAVLAIANRLGANQALGDVIERVARKQGLSG